jgi:hypothetical protein
MTQLLENPAVHVRLYPRPLSRAHSADASADKFLYVFKPGPTGPGMRAATGGRAAGGSSPWGAPPWRPLAWRTRAKGCRPETTRLRHQRRTPWGSPGMPASVTCGSAPQPSHFGAGAPHRPASNHGKGRSGPARVKTPHGLGWQGLIGVVSTQHRPAPMIVRVFAADSRALRDAARLPGGSL